MGSEYSNNNTNSQQALPHGVGILGEGRCSSSGLDSPGERPSPPPLQGKTSLGHAFLSVFYTYSPFLSEYPSHKTLADQCEHCSFQKCHPSPQWEMAPTLSLCQDFPSHSGHQQSMIFPIPTPTLLSPPSGPYMQPSGCFMHLKTQEHDHDPLLSQARGNLPTGSLHPEELQN